MMVLFRRFLVIAVLMFWQGGFFFYASVVVPVGTDVFDHYYRSPSGDGPSGKRQQGRITRTVARWLNVSGALALLPLGWDVFASADPSRRRRRWRGFLCLSVALLLGVLLWLYRQLDGQFNLEKLQLAEEAWFLVRHRVYLWLIAVQWGCCLVYLLLTISAWRAEDGSGRFRS